MEHELKTWQPFFQHVLDGEKTFEVRRNDRGFQRGDTLVLRETEGQSSYYRTGRELRVQVAYVLTGEQFGIRDGYCVMGIKKQEQER